CVCVCACVRACVCVGIRSQRKGSPWWRPCRSSCPCFESALFSSCQTPPVTPFSSRNRSLRSSTPCSRHTQTHKHTNTQTRKHTKTYTHTKTDTHTHTHTHRQKDTHTHTHTH